MRRFLLLLPILAGCTPEAPAVTPGAITEPEGMAQPAPKALGHLHGYVHGAEGETFPAAGAVVKIADRMIRVANPGDPIVTHEADDGRVISVMYDFGEGPVLVERRPRKYLAPGDHPLERKYVYLRRGEFLAEGLAAGKHKLTVAYDEASLATEVAIAAGKTLANQKYQLEVYTPVANEDGSTPRVVDLAAVSPEEGFEATVGPEVTFAAAPTLKVSLKAPPGSAGQTVSAVRLAYAWSAGRSEEVTLPVGPVTVPAGNRVTYGEPVEVTLTLPVEPLAAALAEAEAPESVEAVLLFVDDAGAAIETRALEELEATVAIALTEAP